jgi:hypothetical protein
MDRSISGGGEGGGELVLSVEVASPVVHDVDLVVVGVVAPRANEPLEGSVLELDRLLEGAIERMRVGSGAGVCAGETLCLDQASGVKARRVLLIGLGPAAALRPDALNLAGRVAVQFALDLGVDTLGFAPGLRDAGVTSLAVDEVAHAVATGAREGFASRNSGSTRRLLFSLESSAANRALALAGLSP